jgi:beta-glucosidase
VLWGVSTSAYQIEGAAENDWTEWERAGRLKDRRTRCGRASGHRERWRSDLALLPAIGASAYRYSSSGAESRPRAGEYDLAELARLSEQAGVLETLGIEPVVTLHHYTHPLWFWKEGGWGNPKSVEWFGRLAAALAQALASVASG